MGEKDAISVSFLGQTDYLNFQLFHNAVVQFSFVRHLVFDGGQGSLVPLSLDSCTFARLLKSSYIFWITLLVCDNSSSTFHRTLFLSILQELSSLLVSWFWKPCSHFHQLLATSSSPSSTLATYSMIPRCLYTKWFFLYLEVSPTGYSCRLLTKATRCYSKQRKLFTRSLRSLVWIISFMTNRVSKRCVIDSQLSITTSTLRSFSSTSCSAISRQFLSFWIKGSPASTSLPA